MRSEDHEKSRGIRTPKYSIAVEVNARQIGCTLLSSHRHAPEPARPAMRRAWITRWFAGLWRLSKTGPYVSFVSIAPC